MAVFVVALCCAIPAFADQETLFVQTPTAPVGVGQDVTITINIFGSDIYAYQFNVGFDLTLLQADAVAEGPFLMGAGGTLFFPGTIDNLGGIISFISDSLTGLGPGPSGDGALVSIDFKTVAAGSSAINILHANTFNSFWQRSAPATSSGTVTVTAPAGPQQSVPEPQSIVLAFAGILGLAPLVFSVKHSRSSRA